MGQLTTPDIDSQELLTLLQDGVVVGESDKPLPWGSNFAYALIVRNGDFHVETIYKPRRGERPLWDFPNGTLCQREVAAYVVSEALDWKIVPPTLLRDGPHGTGMYQVRIQANPNANYFTLGPEFRSQLQQIALFDHIINNADRKGGHCLLAHDGRLWAIDHGLCFHNHPKLRTIIWDFAGQQIPPTLLEQAGTFCERLATDNILLSELRKLLSEREIGALQRRTETLVQTKYYPLPGPGRNYPWPPI